MVARYTIHKVWYALRGNPSPIRPMWEGSDRDVSLRVTRGGGRVFGPIEWGESQDSYPLRRERTLGELDCSEMTDLRRPCPEHVIL